MEENNNSIGNKRPTELFDDSDFTPFKVPYVKLPYENYTIIGETAEIDRIVNTFGILNLSVDDVMSTLSKETVNYVVVGTADGEGCIANALKVAIDKLPIETENTSKLLFNIWMSKNSQSPMAEIKLMIDYIESIPSNIDICWGCAYDESLSGEQVKVSLIAASK
ncbi:MAG: hypothetical protein K2K40_00360 [Paramuribaculum sp.]|nr:hypothetical protein [Paramuribaculum sp.]